MDTGAFDTSLDRVYALWHIPSSTLLVTTSVQHDVECRVQRALSDGCKLADLMLQITGRDELIGHQHLGDHIAEALHLTVSPPPMESPACDGTSVR